ncbi:MAG TPA: arginine deiminase family protein [Gemmatimonadaceae bacterium]|nr:arginine deiminase family protein [Gemmatimonadaceae bacterium]
MPRVALTRAVSASLANCELTYLAREPIDLDRARRQHAAYEKLLTSFGRSIVRLPTLDEQPDAVFVEDAAIALDELAVVAPMGAASRVPESRTIEDALAKYLPVKRLTRPATLDGGDVLRVERRIFVGISRRTNTAAVEQLTRLLGPYDYEVIPVSVAGALHLKSACTSVGGQGLLANPEWVDVRPFAHMEIIPVDPSEAWGASVLDVDGRVVMLTGFPGTAGTLRDRGLDVHEIDLTELRKAEGGPTCLSILLPDVT